MKCFICGEMSFNEICKPCEIALKASKKSLSRRKLIKEKFQNCYYCGKKLDKRNFSVDHLIPKSKGGNNSLFNLVGCCKECNMRKSDKLFNEFLKEGKDAYK